MKKYQLKNHKEAFMFLADMPHVYLFIYSFICIAPSRPASVFRKQITYRLRELAQV